MLYKVKDIVYKLVSVANIVAIILLFLIGNVDKLQPIAHPWLANFGLGFPIVLAINVLFIIFWVIARPKRVWLPLLGLIICYAPIRKHKERTTCKVYKSTIL